MVYEITNTKAAAPLFEGWEETIIWSCLDGTMGKIYGDAPEYPEAAMAILGDFAFLAGTPKPELAAYKPDWCRKDYIILVPRHEAWTDLIMRHYQGRASIITRYATKKEPDVFDIKKLEELSASLPTGYEMFPIDERLYRQCRDDAWSEDLVMQFPCYESYRDLGLGVVICRDGQVVSGASSYSRYRTGIEIEIDTREEYRRKGLAAVCGAKLILECQKRNLYPSWDAHNKESIALAQKLGYHYSHAYTAVEIRGY